MLRKETLESILKTRKAYPHEAVEMAQELLKGPAGSEIPAYFQSFDDEACAGWLRSFMRQLMATPEGNQIHLVADNAEFVIRRVPKA